MREQIVEIIEELREAMRKNAAPLYYREALKEVNMVQINSDLLLRLTEEEHMCETCDKEFATCEASPIFGIDLYPNRTGEEADIVLDCSSHNE